MRNWVRLEERPSMAIVIDPAHKKKTALIPNYAIVPIQQYIYAKEKNQRTYPGKFQKTQARRGIWRWGIAARGANTRGSEAWCRTKSTRRGNSP